MKLSLAPLAIFLLSCAAQTVSAQVPAFPGAEGAGAMSVGGRGGRAIHVTNLNDSGPGSLRAALDASGPRTVIFDVGGTIRLTKRLMRRAHSDAVKQQILEEGRIFAERLASPEAKEAMNAFLEKRKPDFSRF